MRSTRPLLILLLVACFASACTTNHDNPSTGDDTAAKPKPKGPLREVKCVDAQIGALSLLDEPSDAVVRDESMDNGVYESFLDTSAGGLNPSKSFSYVRFSEKGLQRVAISDEDAFTSLDWDMALRRFVIRLNSGVSGPGDVKGARTRPNTTFESLSSVPDGVEYREEEYFSDDCELISDSGIGSPATALASFWSYVTCVAMTHNVYVIETQDMRHVKFEVLGYYPPGNQKICDDTGKVPNPTGAGNMRIRWAYLD
jgi:hypothetical protein